MDISTTIKYIAAGLFVLYLIFNFFRKKDANNKPIVGWRTMAFFIILYAAILVSFVIASDWPMVVIFATFVIWGIQGAIASKKSVKKKMKMRIK